MIGFHRWEARILQFSFFVMVMISRLNALNIAELMTVTQLQSSQDQGDIYLSIGVATFCILFAGMMSGLTVGLASIDRLSLEVDSIDNPEVKRMTERIFPVID